jgi:DNA helicase II / ATP-dependent DNA helicase PcrA
MLLDIGYKLFEPVGKMFEAHLSNAVRKWLSEKNDNEDDQHLVWLLTAHGAKGLEFDWVFVAGMNEGGGSSDKGAIDEERRLFYVAMSRARSRLFVSGTNAKILVHFWLGLVWPY